MWKRTIISGAAALFLALAGVQTAAAQVNSDNAVVTVNVPQVLAIDLQNADVTFTQSETETAILGSGSVQKSPSGASVLYRGNVAHDLQVGYAGSGLSDGKILSVEVGSGAGFDQIGTAATTIASNGGPGSSGQQDLSWELSGLDINTPPTSGETATVTFTVVAQ
jgi:hypothetical protein